MMRNNLFQNTFIYTIGNLLSKIIGFLMLPVYTNYLTTSQFGRFDLLVTAVTLMLPIVTLQISDAAYRFLVDEEDDREKEKVITNAFYGLLINVVVGFLVVMLILMFTYQITYTRSEFILFFLLAFSNLLFVFLQQVIRGLKSNKEFAMSGIINALLLALLNILFLVFLDLEYIGLLLANILAYFLAVAYIFIKINIFKYIKLKLFNAGMYRILILYSIPLIPNLISWWAINFSDRMLISYYLGVDQNGIYAIANRFSTILFFMTTVFNLAWQESAILSFKDRDKDNYYTEIFGKYLRFLFSTILILISGIGIAVPLILNESYQEAQFIIPFLFYGVVFSAFSSFYGTAFQSSKNTKEAVISSLASGIINIGLNIVLLPKMGVIAAGISTLIAFLCMWLVRVYQTKKYFNININMRDFLSLTIINILFVSMFFGFQSLYIKLLLFVLSIAIFAAFNRDMVSKILTKLGSLKRR
ncbi:hypothetical protein HMPREF3291_04390 [Bacillus sp. HMSC76G11]|nr:hypothetical protein HMPREF3291_04390 [Bacillus sp. HMSC76G11]